MFQHVGHIQHAQNMVKCIKITEEKNIYLNFTDLLL